MTIDDRPDGALVLSERMTLLRWGSLTAGGLLAAALIATRLTLGSGDTRTLLAGGLVSVLALSLAAFVPDRTFVFEPALGRMTWARKRLIGSRQGHDTADRHSRRDAPSRPGQRLQATAAQLPSGLGDAGGVDAALERAGVRPRGVRAAGGPHPRADPRPPHPPASTIASLAAAGQIVDAVTLARRDRGMGLAEARDYVESLRKSSARMAAGLGTAAAARGGGAAAARGAPVACYGLATSSVDLGV